MIAGVGLFIVVTGLVLLRTLTDCVPCLIVFLIVSLVIMHSCFS